MYCLVTLTMTLVPHLYELRVCFPLISSTFVCAVLHAMEKGYPVLVIVIIEHSMRKLKPMHILSRL